MKIMTFANTVSTREVAALYERWVLPLNNAPYLNKHQTLPSPPEFDLSPEWVKWDFPRVAAILEFKEWSAKYGGFANGRALISSGRGDAEMKYVKAAEVDYADYDIKTEANDLHTLNLPRKDYGFVMANQTLEHVYNPYLCVQNIYNHMKPGGYFYMNMPILNIPHFIPFHFSTGMTPVGLLAMFHSLGFEILEVGQWGNFEYIQKLFTMHYWPVHGQLTSRVSEFRNAVSVWTLVRKP